MDKTLEQMSISCGMKALMMYVRANGMSTDLETINKIADIVGNTNIPDLKEAQQKDSSQFFFIMKHIWSFGDCVRFYEEHCSKTMKEQLDEIEKLDMELSQATRKSEQLAETLSVRTTSLEEMRTEADRLRKALNAGNATYSDTRMENISLNKKVSEMEFEMIRLKAQLYDFEKAKATQNI